MNFTDNVSQVLLKPYEINYFVRSSFDAKQNMVNDFKIDRQIQNHVFTGKLNNNSMFFFDSRNICGIFIEISSKFIHNTKHKTLNPLIDEFLLLKNHLRGQNYESAFKILTIIQNFSLWIQGLFLIVNKLCQSPNNILLIKRHALSSIMEYLKEKAFEDEKTTITVNNIKVLCFSNFIYRCISVKQYEYAYLIAEKLNMPFYFKIIAAHAKLNKFSGIAYLANCKIEVLFLI